MVVGQLVGTGAAMNVECGFAPRKVEVFNATKLSITNWNYGMVTAWDEGFHVVDSGAGTTDLSLLTANGISLFAGEPVNTTKTGTLAGTIATTSITGTSTEFLSELRVGDEILISGVVYSVLGIADDTHLTLDRALGATISGVALVRVTGRQAGFVIGTTATLNANNDAISYTAWR
jgi:hypothetical protein